jgi:hypothetical protein
LQADALTGRVAELGSLIWLEYVKQAIPLLSEDFHFFPVCDTAAFLSQKQERFTAVINAEMRESTPLVFAHQRKLSTGHGPTRRFVLVRAQGSDWLPP